MIFLMGFVQTAEQLVFMRTVQGLITGVIAASSALVAAVTPGERTGYTMGLLVGGVLPDRPGFEPLSC